MEYYDIHGFKIEVNDPVSGIFRQEYGWARVQTVPDNTDLFVKQYHGRYISTIIEHQRLPTDY